MIQQRLAIIAVGATLALAGAAPAVQAADPTPETVRLTLSTEGWVQTQTARVEVTAQLTLVEENRDEMRKEVLAALEKISPEAEWRITRFARGTDGSGAERWTVMAETRLPQERLDGIAQRARDASRPGRSYQVGAIHMTPSLAEREAAVAGLRQDIYGMASKEVENAAPLWPGRDIQVIRVDFAPEPSVRAVAQPRMALAEAAPNDAGTGAAPIAVEEKMTLTATVVIGPQPRPEP